MGVVESTPTGYGRIPIKPQMYIVDSAGYAYGPLITDGTKELRLDPGERVMQLVPSDLTLHGYVRADVLDRNLNMIDKESERG